MGKASASLHHAITNNRQAGKVVTYMLIYLIRHGETRLNATGTLQGWMDVPLNQNGIDLARITGKNMTGIRFDRCISSPLIRARQTAKIVLEYSGNGDVPIETDERIKEINCGDLEGKHLSAMGENGPLFFRDPHKFPGFPGGESIAELCKRTAAFLNDLTARDDGFTYLIGIHGCALRALLNPLYDDPSDYWHSRIPYNCVVNVIESVGGKPRLIVDDKLYYDESLAVNHYKER